LLQGIGQGLSSTAAIISDYQAQEAQKKLQEDMESRKILIKQIYTMLQDNPGLRNKPEFVDFVNKSFKDIGGEALGSALLGAAEFATVDPAEQAKAQIAAATASYVTSPAQRQMPSDVAANLQARGISSVGGMMATGGTGAARGAIEATPAREVSLEALPPADRVAELRTRMAALTPGEQSLLVGAAAPQLDIQASATAGREARATTAEARAGRAETRAERTLNLKKWETTERIRIANRRLVAQEAKAGKRQLIVKPNLRIPVDEEGRYKTVDRVYDKETGQLIRETKTGQGKSGPLATATVEMGTITGEERRDLATRRKLIYRLSNIRDGVEEYREYFNDFARNRVSIYTADSKWLRGRNLPEGFMKLIANMRSLNQSVRKQEFGTALNAGEMQALTEILAQVTQSTAQIFPRLDAMLEDLQLGEQSWLEIARETKLRGAKGFKPTRTPGGATQGQQPQPPPGGIQLPDTGVIIFPAE